MNHSQSAPVTRPLRPAAAQAQERMHANPDGIDLTLHDEFVLRPARKSLSAPGSAKKKAPAKAKAKGKTTAKSASKAKEEKSAVKSEHEAPAEAAAGSSSASAQAHEAGGGGGGPLVKKEPEIQQARAEEGGRVTWTKEMLQIFFNVCGRDKFKEQLRKAAGFGYKTHLEMYDKIAEELKMENVDGEVCSKKMDNMIQAMKRYHTKKRQSGTSADKVAKARAAQGVVELEEILRKDRPRFEPGSLLDSSAEAPAVAADGDADADGNGDGVAMDERQDGEAAEAKAADEKESKERKEGKEGKGKDKAQAKVDPHAAAPDPRPPGVSRKKRKGKADAGTGPLPKTPRKSSVKAATDALLARLDEKEKARAAAREKERQEDAKLRQAEIEVEKQKAESIRLLAMAVEKSSRPAAAAVPGQQPPAAAAPPLSPEAMAAAARQMTPQQREMLKNML